ncbi:MAG TPA: MOSC domain-containing protein [Acidimicrobiia bacterium]|nr:MOSC domain-containing protein [Acidimicrobiia bacterium]
MLVHLDAHRLEAGLDYIRQAPNDDGTVDLIVRRPRVDEREVLEEATLDLSDGLLGDSWKLRPSASTLDGTPHPLMQLNVMNSRVIALIAGAPDRWPLAGDQLYLDLDLSEDNLPAGSRLALGGAIIEVTEVPHRGCQKFSGRFGMDALRFVNSEVGRSLRLRGLNARVLEPGVIRRGDPIKKAG